MFTYGGPDTAEQVNDFDDPKKMVETLLELTLNRGWPHWFNCGIAEAIDTKISRKFVRSQKIGHTNRLQDLQIGYAARGHLAQIMTMCGMRDLIYTFNGLAIGPVRVWLG